MEIAILLLQGMAAARGRRALAAVRAVRVLMAGGAAVAMAGCGGSSPAPAPTKGAWSARHGAAVATLNADLDAARTTLSSLQRPDILGNCNQLRDSLGEARKGLPVGDPTADAALRAGLAAVGVGVEDCIRGAQGPNIPQLEKSFSELREAHTLMDVANRTLDAWR